MTTDFLNDLNENQRKAVLATEGPVMVIAGAGSGKTRVLTYRIAHLIQKGVDPFNILALTFTNKAAKEMKERIGQLIGASEAKNLWMGTFHSVFARILRAEADRLGYPSNFNIYDTQDAQNVLKKCIEDLKLDAEIYKPKAIQARISQYKNNLITVLAYFNSPELMEMDAAARKPKLGEIYQLYVERCFRAGAMDFDDLLLKTNELLTRFPDVLAKYQNRFRYILVDEYQDTNHSQYLIVKALASRYENICVVGDDAQSIYAFRGANIANILNFTKDYSDVVTIALEQNYRSTKNIVNAANSIIQNNRDQLEKKVYTHNEEGEKIKVYRGLSDADEANFIANTIHELMLREQLKPYDFAVLYRTNQQSRAIEDALRKRNLPYHVYGGMSFYQRKEVKDVVAYLRILVNPRDDEALLRIINYPSRGIGDSTQNRLMILADEQKVPIFEVLQQIVNHQHVGSFNSGIRQKLIHFWELIQSFKLLLRQQEPHEVLIHLLQKTGIMKELKDDGTPEAISRLENIQELINSLQGYVDEQKQLEDGQPTLEGFLENITLATDIQKDQLDDKNSVSLMTIHLSKGLEFPVVFVCGLEENLFPNAQSIYTRAELEEERRLFYVASTRAQKRLFYTYCTTRFRWGKIIYCDPSRFLDEVDDEYLCHLNLNIPPKNNSGLRPEIFGSFQRSNQNGVQKETIIVEKKYPAPHLKPINSVLAQQPHTTQPITLVVGDRVAHDRFGNGEIIALEADGDNPRATIRFDVGGEKKLLLKFAKLRKLE